MLQLQVRVDQGVMAMRRYYTFHKAPGPKPDHQLPFHVISKTFIVLVSYPCAEIQSVYSIALATDWAGKEQRCVYLTECTF